MSQGNISTTGSSTFGANGNKAYSFGVNESSGEITGARSSSIKFACNVGHSVTPSKFVPINSISNSFDAA